MSSDDIDYLKNHLPNTLYVNPGQNGAYATLVSDGETMLGEIEVTPRSRLAVSAFYVNDKKDYGTFKLTKLTYHKTYKWREDGCIRINNFYLSHLMQFVSLLAALDLSDAKKARISLDRVQLETLKTLVASPQGNELLKSLSNAPELHNDIYAVAAKREALREFQSNLEKSVSEPDWQAFFERNTWIFGHGLNYVFLDKVAEKLEATTTGKTFDEHGKRADGLMYTRAEVSQYVLIEIKRNNTDLLRSDPYRSGCWTVSEELSNAVTQVQKTTFEFTQNRFRDRRKDSQGNDKEGYLYAVDPKSYLIIGNLSTLSGNDDKITCFELYRRNVRAPEILTFDELYYRARCILENLSPVVHEPPSPEEVPF
jgi:hypothetical protein